MFCSVSLTNVFLLTVMYVKDTQLSLGNGVAKYLEKGLPALLAIRSFCGCLIVILSFPLMIVSVPEIACFSCKLCPS